MITRDTDIISKSVEHVIDNIIGESVVDVGCGSGYLCKQIKQKRNINNIVGYDIQKLRDTHNDIKYVNGDILNLPFDDDSFDTVICSHTLEHIRDIDSAIEQLRRITKKRLIIVIPRQREYKYSFDLHIHFFPYIYSVKNKFNSSKCQYFLIDNDFMYIEDKQ